MHNETRISSRQAILLILFAHIATTVNFIPSSLLNFLTQDAWISIIPGAILAIMFSYYPIADLGIRFPGQSLVQLSEKLLHGIGEAVRFHNCVYCIYAPLLDVKEFRGVNGCRNTRNTHVGLYCWTFINDFLCSKKRPEYYHKHNSSTTTNQNSQVKNRNHGNWPINQY